MKRLYVIIPIILVLLFVYFIYKTIQYANGDTDAQREALEQMKEASERAAQATRENSQWYQDELDKFKREPVAVARYKKTEAELRYEKFKEECAILADELTKDASKSKNKKVVESWNKLVDSNYLVRIALGDQLEEWSGTGLDSYTFSKISDIFELQKNKARVIQSKLFRAHLRKFSVQDPVLQEAYETVRELRNRYVGDEFYRRAYMFRDSIADPKSSDLISSKDMTWGEFQAILDPTLYQEYHVGLYNILTYIINSVEKSFF